MRYYAEWLDGEYVLLNKKTPGYDHYATAHRAMKFHALFGSTIVLSDVQMVDFRTPLLHFFRDAEFRSFLQAHPKFLSLAGSPVSGINDQHAAIALKGLERISDQADKPPDSYEMVVT